MGFWLIIYSKNASYRDVRTILNVESCALLKPVPSKTIKSPSKARPNGCSAQVAFVSKFQYKLDKTCPTPHTYFSACLVPAYDLLQGRACKDVYSEAYVCFELIHIY